MTALEMSVSVFFGAALGLVVWMAWAASFAVVPVSTLF